MTGFVQRDSEKAAESPRIWFACLWILRPAFSPYCTTSFASQSTSHRAPTNSQLPSALSVLGTPVFDSTRLSSRPSSSSTQLQALQPRPCLQPKAHKRLSLTSPSSSESTRRSIPLSPSPCRQLHALAPTSFSTLAELPTPPGKSLKARRANAALPRSYTKFFAAGAFCCSGAAFPPLPGCLERSANPLVLSLATHAAMTPVGTLRFSLRGSSRGSGAVQHLRRRGGTAS